MERHDLMIKKKTTKNKSTLFYFLNTDKRRKTQTEMDSNK